MMQQAAPAWDGRLGTAGGAAFGQGLRDLARERMWRTTHWRRRWA